MFGTTRKSPAEPTDVPVENKQFSGLIDKVQVYNEARSPATVKILSGGHFEFAAPPPPPKLDAALAERIKAAKDGKMLQ